MLRRKVRGGWPVWLLLAALLPATAQAEPRSLIDPAKAHALRDLRSLDSRARGGAGARIQLERTRREIQRPGNGIDYLPEGARLNRELDRIERDLERPIPAPVRAQPGVGELPRSYGASEGLPSSLDGEGGTAAGGSNNLTAAARLLLRAERALDGGRVPQARSDLVAAKSFLDDVAAVPPAATRREALAQRLEALERRTAAAEDG